VRIRRALSRWCDTLFTLVCPLAIDDPRLDATDPLKMTIRYINYFFTAAFIIEMLLKIVVLGFIHSKIKEMPAYLRSGWNILDFCVVVISILSLMNMDAVQGLQALRTFRALRPLRLISRLEGITCIHVCARSSAR